MKVLCLFFLSSLLAFAAQVELAGSVQITGGLGLSDGTPAIPDGVTMEFLLDEGSGTILKDNCEEVSPPAHCGGSVDDDLDLTLGAGSWGAGYLDLATNTNGNRVDSADVGTGAFSVSAWIYLNTFLPAATASVFTKNIGNPDFGMVFRHSSANEIRLTVYDDDTDTVCREYDYDFNGTMAVDEWHNYVVVWDGGTTDASIQAYLDGVLITTSTDCGSGTFNTRHDGTERIRLGNSVSSSAEARMSLIRFWTLELSASDAADVFNHGRTP